MNKRLMKVMGFGKQVKDVEQKRCPFCQCKIDENSFKDELSMKEFKISGLCQQCQDEVF